MGLYPNSWQGPLSTSLFWKWLGLALTLGLHGLVCTRVRVLGLSGVLVLSVFPYGWLEIKLARRGKSLAPLWLGDPTTNDHGSNIKTEARYRDWDKFVPFGLRRTRRHNRNRNPFIEQAATMTKLRTRQRANSVAFTCNTKQSVSAKDTEPQPSSSTADNHRASITNEESSVLPVS